MSWNDILRYVIMGIIALLGSPVTQWLKNKLKWEDRYALALTAVIAGIFALGEMLLSQVIGWKDFTLANFPVIFGAVFTLGTLYYQWLKDSPSKFGAGGLLKKLE